MLLILDIPLLYIIFAKLKPTPTKGVTRNFICKCREGATVLKSKNMFTVQLLSINGFVILYK